MQFLQGPLVAPLLISAPSLLDFLTSYKRPYFNMFALLIPTALAILPLARAEWEWTAGQTAWVVVVSVIGSFIILSIIGTCIRSAYLANKMAEQFQQYRPPPPLQQNVYSVSVPVFKAVACFGSEEKEKRRGTMANQRLTGSPD